MNKDLAFGEVIVLRVVVQSNKVGFLGTSPVNPSIGAAALGLGTAPGINGQFCTYISGLSLYLAVQQREDVVEARLSDLKEGYKVIVPYIYVQKDNITGSRASSSDPSTACSCARPCIW